MQEKKRAKVKKGWVAVVVGLEDVDGGSLQRFAIPISYLHHPQFRRLLEAAQEVYGYSSSGPLKLPCSVDDFLHLRWLIERESLGNGDVDTANATSLLPLCSSCQKPGKMTLLKGIDSGAWQHYPRSLLSSQSV